VKLNLNIQELHAQAFLNQGLTNQEGNHATSTKEATQSGSTTKKERTGSTPKRHQMHDKSPMTSQGYGMIPHFIPTCHFCGVDGHIRPNCFRYIKQCRVESMMERKRLRRAKMHVPRK
jgi:hypothetical protein